MSDSEIQEHLAKSISMFGPPTFEPKNFEFLYHGTSMHIWEAIKAGGLRPRLDDKSNWECTSLRDHVYLTQVYAAYFAFVASCEAVGSTPEDDENVEARPNWLIIQVARDDLNELDMFPDEDFLWHATRSDPKWNERCWESVGTTGDADIKEQTVALGQHIDDWKHLWLESLCSMSTCSHRGIIQKFKAYEFAWKDHPNLVMNAIDPIIAPINFKFCGDKYDQLTKDIIENSTCLGEIELE